MSAADVLTFRCAKNVSIRCIVIQMCQECQQLPWQIDCQPLMFRCAKNVSNCLGRCIDIQMCQECQHQMYCHSDVPRMCQECQHQMYCHPLMFRCCQECQHQMYCHPLMFRCAKNVSISCLVCSDVPRMSASDVLSFRCAKNVMASWGTCLYDTDWQCDDKEGICETMAVKITPLPEAEHGILDEFSGDDDPDICTAVGPLYSVDGPAYGAHGDAACRRVTYRDRTEAIAKAGGDTSRVLQCRVDVVDRVVCERVYAARNQLLIDDTPLTHSI
jgi:hypothetical protein